MITLSWVTLCMFALVRCDIYMHNPRGSNDRLNEKTANRKNANRVFDSQNNNKGGYNVGDLTDQPANNDANKQYQMRYFASSIHVKKAEPAGGRSQLLIEWTNQHGCGGNEDTNPNKLNCDLVLQYLCRPKGTKITNAAKDAVRDGTKTATNDYQQPGNNEKMSGFNTRKNNNVKTDRVLQEPFEWYDKCAVRERNKGLFTADQKLNGNSARSTRQNPNGQKNRYGYECPEERDYYPYWHPTDWKDIAVLAQNQSMCQYYQKHSFNTKSKFECYESANNVPRHYSKHNNEATCVANGGEWLEYQNYLEIDTSVNTAQQCQNKNNAQNRAANIRYFWGRPMYHGKTDKCLVALDKPDCKEAPFSRDNHLGNGADLEHLHYLWTLPYFPSEKEQQCVLRIRYNISTDDYDPWNTSSSKNQNINAQVFSPVQQNPLVDIGVEGQGLRLAINTAQYGRTFQDRSHMFYILPRPDEVSDTANIANLNVRGKRGNIVQTYPAVEYDFVPTDLKLTTQQLVHVQWTGSNTHNNQGGGDGQAGDDGEGKGGTDRNNIVAMIESAPGDRMSNFPSPFETPANLFNHVELVWARGLTQTQTRKMTSDDLAVMFASAGKYACAVSSTCAAKSLESTADNQLMDDVMNNAPASFQGALVRVRDAGVYHYLCTRNNNFSNRSQKGSIIVEKE